MGRDEAAQALIQLLPGQGDTTPEEAGLTARNRGWKKGARKGGKLFPGWF